MAKESAEVQEAATVVPANKESIGKWAWSFWKPTITGGAVLTLSAGAMVLTYLKKIDRIDLLQHALASKDGLTLVVVMALVLSVTLFICLFASALITHSAASIYTSHSDIPEKMPAFLTCIQILWLLAMFVMMYSGGEFGKKLNPSQWVSKHYGTIMVVFMVMSGIAGGVIQVLERKPGLRTSPPRDQWCWSMAKKFFFGSFVGFMFAAGTMFSAFAAWAFLVMNPEIGKQKIDFLTSLIFVVTAVPGVLISNYFLRSYCRTGDMRKSQRESAIGSIMVAAFVCLTIPQRTLYPIDMRALSAAGIYSTSKVTYLIKSKDERLNFKSAGFDLKFTDNDVAVIDGYARFHLGSLLVLCSEPYDPLVPDQSGDAKDALTTAQKVDEKSDLKGGCLDTSDEDVKRITLGKTLGSADKDQNGGKASHGPGATVTSKDHSA
jgi:hypothetical protein